MIRVIEYSIYPNDVKNKIYKENLPLSQILHDKIRDFENAPTVIVNQLNS